jgi:hypothetical protein
MRVCKHRLSPAAQRQIAKLLPMPGQVEKDGLIQGIALQQAQMLSYYTEAE